MDHKKENSKIWDHLVEINNVWSVPVTSEAVAQARNGIWSVVLTPTKPVPRDWFPERLEGKRILCLACGGGQQGPILAALGASVTVLDNSRKQLEQDEFVANRDSLTQKRKKRIFYLTFPPICDISIYNTRKGVDGDSRRRAKAAASRGECKPGVNSAPAEDPSGAAGRTAADGLHFDRRSMRYSKPCRFFTVIGNTYQTGVCQSDLAKCSAVCCKGWFAKHCLRPVCGTKAFFIRSIWSGGESRRSFVLIDLYSD